MVISRPHYNFIRYFVASIPYSNTSHWYKCDKSFYRFDCSKGRLGYAQTWMWFCSIYLLFLHVSLDYFDFYRNAMVSKKMPEDIRAMYKFFTHWFGSKNGDVSQTIHYGVQSTHFTVKRERCTHLCKVGWRSKQLIIIIIFLFARQRISPAGKLFPIFTKYTFNSNFAYGILISFFSQIRHKNNLLSVASKILFESNAIAYSHFSTRVKLVSSKVFGPLKTQLNGFKAFAARFWDIIKSPFFRFFKGTRLRNRSQPLNY